MSDYTLVLLCRSDNRLMFLNKKGRIYGSSTERKDGQFFRRVYRKCTCESVDLVSMIVTLAYSTANIAS